MSATISTRPLVRDLCPDVIGQPGISQYSGPVRSDWTYVPTADGRHYTLRDRINPVIDIPATTPEELAAELRRRVKAHADAAAEAKRVEAERYAALPLWDNERQVNRVEALRDRGDDALAAWAVEWLGIDLPAVWDDLSDEQRDYLVESGAVDEVTATVECTGAQHWKDDWRTESGVSWPTYDLEVTAPGLAAPIKLTGWHLVGFFGPGGNRQHEEWCEANSDGGGNGLPRVNGWTIESGDNVGTDHPVPVWRHDGQWVTLDRDALGDRHWGSLTDAAGDADHGDEPTWEDVTVGDLDDEAGTVYITRNGEIETVTLWTGGVAGKEVGDSRGSRRRATIEYAASAWGHDLTDEIFETADHCRADLAAMADDDEVYDSEADALRAVAAMVLERAGDLPDGVTARDNVGVVVLEWTRTEAEGVESEEETTLDEADMACVLRHGWAGVLDTYGIAHATGVLVHPGGHIVYATPDRWVSLKLFSVVAGTGDADGTVILDSPRAACPVYDAARDNPADHTAALALADWLDENVTHPDTATATATIRQAVAIEEGR